MRCGVVWCSVRCGVCGVVCTSPCVHQSEACTWAIKFWVQSMLHTFLLDSHVYIRAHGQSSFGFKVCVYTLSCLDPQVCIKARFAHGQSSFGFKVCYTLSLFIPAGFPCVHQSTWAIKFWVQSVLHTFQLGSPKRGLHMGNQVLGSKYATHSMGTLFETGVVVWCSVV